MPLPSKPAPEFTRKFLIELADGMAYKQAERLFETAAVTSVKWESPVLKGSVKGVEDTYTPELNLRSTVFAENRCNCLDGRRRKVCAHALAIALHYEALKQESKHAAMENPDAQIENAPDAQVVVEEPVLAKLKSIYVDAAGDQLRLLVFLPPNFEQAVGRDGVVIKFEAAAGKQVLALSALSPTRTYHPVSEQQFEALRLIESWCGGRLANLVQLTAARLKRLLKTLEGETCIYWLKKPHEPIMWSGADLKGVSEFLAEAEIEEEESEETVAIVEEKTPKRLIRASVSLREKSKPNPRRIAEAKAQDNWKHRKGDFPTASAVSDSMEQYAQNRIIVDGSPNFIAIRLPMDREDTSIAPLRNILKLEGFMLEPSNRKWWLRERHKTLNFLAAHWTELRDKWRAVFTENFKVKLAHIEVADLSVEVKENEGSFTLELGMGDASEAESLRKSVSSGKHYIDSEETGKIRLLNKASMDKLHAIEKAVSGQADRPFTPTFQKSLQTQDLADVESLLEEMTEGWQPPQAWQSRSLALKQVGALEPAPIRGGLDSTLRSYQRIGVAWLWHLYRNELGGILADEMGLGKTIQALALIECIQSKNTARKPSLVVCPASLVENWAREASRFVPALSIVRHHGTGRAKEAHELERVDIVITSYGTLRQDADMLADMDWSVVIGDEAQHIKNRRTQNAKSLLRLRSGGRFLLTGTPVENSLDDLLSLFAFLMPGYLSQAPSNLSVDDKNWHSKRQTARAAAYILRRTKKEVAPELPDKIEKTFFCEFGRKQARFYQDTLERTRRDIFNLEMSGANAGKVRFAAFTELLRLRQACVDPRIIDDTFSEQHSTKLNAFDEILEECLDSGSRILVFSSFVTALKLLAERLEKGGHRYCYLDGQTRNRLAVCDQFNEDEGIPVFLISLKAGGTGLNLTGADTVVHYDPWWNPAAEAQATDRAHRIGQKRVVTSIKLIATNTVEEKVLELQAKKSEILKELFEESEHANAKVSLDDIKGLLT